MLHFCFTGKILENLTLGAPKSVPSPPSQPPTPPSTPLSPKSSDFNNSKYTSTPSFASSNMTITQTSSPSLPQNLSQNLQKGPLNLGTKNKTKTYTNGTGLNLSGVQSAEFAYAHVDMEMGRDRGGERSPGGSSQSSRVSLIFDLLLLFKNQRICCGKMLNSFGWNTVRGKYVPYKSGFGALWGQYAPYRKKEAHFANIYLIRHIVQLNILPLLCYHTFIPRRSRKSCYSYIDRRSILFLSHPYLVRTCPKYPIFFLNL